MNLAQGLRGLMLHVPDGSAEFAEGDRRLTVIRVEDGVAPLGFIAWEAHETRWRPVAAGRVMEGDELAITFCEKATALADLDQLVEQALRQRCRETPRAQMWTMERIAS